MTNQEAINLIRGKSVTSSKAQKLAAMWAMEDIVMHDVKEWVDTPIHEALYQFVSIGRNVMDDYIEKGFDDEQQHRTFAEGAIGIAESMCHYAEIHHDLSEKYTSER